MREIGKRKRKEKEERGKRKRKEIEEREKRKRKEEREAELQYTSWWDGSEMKFEMGGMDPTCRHPKPRPTKPHDLFDSLILLYCMYTNNV